MRAVKLKVYGWTGFRPEAPKPHRQTREIVAARSKAAARLLAHPTNPSFVSLSEIIETGNAQEIETAMREPGVVFWCGLDESYRNERRWRRQAS